MVVATGFDVTFLRYKDREPSQGSVWWSGYLCTSTQISLTHLSLQGVAVLEVVLLVGVGAGDELVNVGEHGVARITPGLKGKKMQIRDTPALGSKNYIVLGYGRDEKGSCVRI